MALEIIFPDTKKLHIEFLKTYRDEFLKLNNLKIGDEIELEFDYQVLRTSYNRREQNAYTFKKLAKGVLKLDEDNCLYAESLDDFTFYWNAPLRTGSNKYAWRSENRKSIKKLGTGFIYK